MSATKFRRDENELLQNTRDPHPLVTTAAKPRILTIISNVDRSSREKVSSDVRAKAIIVLVQYWPRSSGCVCEKCDINTVKVIKLVQYIIAKLQSPSST